MTSRNADYDLIFPCTLDSKTFDSHHWLKVPDLDFGTILKCVRCHIVQLPTAVTGDDLFPHGPYEIPNAHTRREGDKIVSEPHIMVTIGDAYDAFRTAPGNRDGSYPSQTHFVRTLTAGGLAPELATCLYKRNRHSIIDFHWTNSPDVARIPLV